MRLTDRDDINIPKETYVQMKNQQMHKYIQTIMNSVLFFKLFLYCVRFKDKVFEGKSMDMNRISHNI